MKKMKPSAAIRRELLSYLFWGILTTVVSWGSYTLFAWLLGKGVAVGQTKLVFWANFCSWLCAVLFSFVTNKIWVFQSRSWGAAGNGGGVFEILFLPSGDRSAGNCRGAAVGARRVGLVDLRHRGVRGQGDRQLDHRGAQLFCQQIPGVLPEEKLSRGTWEETT